MISKYTNGLGIDGNPKAMSRIIHESSIGAEAFAISTARIVVQSRADRYTKWYPFLDVLPEFDSAAFAGCRRYHGAMCVTA
jgi:hypothetical protein